MVTQSILNFFRDFVTTWFVGLPALPSNFYDFRDWWVTMGGWMHTNLGPWGVIVPFSTMGTLLTIWAGLVAFWLLALAAKVVLWAVGR
jgi:hypothetical protein